MNNSIGGLRLTVELRGNVMMMMMIYSPRKMFSPDLFLTLWTKIYENAIAEWKDVPFYIVIYNFCLKSSVLAVEIVLANSKVEYKDLDTSHWENKSYCNKIQRSWNKNYNWRRRI